MAAAAARQPTQAELAAMNMAARQLIIDAALKRTQLLTAQSINIALQSVVQVPPRNVGIILGFLVNILTNVSVTAGGTPLTLTPFGAANLVSQFRYDDLNNNTRIQTPGWHINLINSVRGGIPYLAVDALSTVPTPYPVSYGAWYPTLISAAATIAATANSDVNFTYFVPLAYSDQDLRGAVFANVIQATQNLQLQLNANPVQARTLSGWLNAVYCTVDGVTAPLNVVVANFSVNIWQVYYDQLPISDNGPVLPLMDLQTVYDIKQTSLPTPIVGQDTPIAFSNYRDFLATCLIFVNNVTVAGAFGLETDVNYISMQAANFTEVFKVPPKIAATWGRTTIGLDFPRNSWYIPTRARPISTIQYGNIDVVLNATVAAVGSFLAIGYESFSLQNFVGQAQSLTSR